MWSHMIADSREELHEFAKRLGLRRSWFQDPMVNGKSKPAEGSRAAENWHYDVTETKRREAIHLGAVEVSWRDLPGIIEKRREGRAPASLEQQLGDALPDGKTAVRGFAAFLADPEVRAQPTRGGLPVAVLRRHHEALGFTAAEVDQIAVRRGEATP